MSSVYYVSFNNCEVSYGCHYSCNMKIYWLVISVFYIAWFLKACELSRASSKFKLILFLLEILLNTLNGA